jgi:peptidoglycan hydrolase-like protein with peptidoglycan-binding domain
MTYREIRRKNDGEAGERARLQRKDGDGAEKQVASLHAAIGNAAFTRMVQRAQPTELVGRVTKDWKGSSAGPSAAPMLRKGSAGGAVVDLQMRLSAYGHRIGEDGRFGHETAVAVRAFQAEHGLNTDGIVGPATWAALGAGTASKGADVGDKGYELDEKGAADEKGASIDDKGAGAYDKGYEHDEKGYGLEDKGATDEKGASIDDKGAGAYDKGYEHDEKGYGLEETGTTY